MTAASPWDEDDRIGLPVSRKSASPKSQVETRPADSGRATLGLETEPELRPGDAGLGRPAMVPAAVSPLSDDDRRRLREADEDQARRDLAEAEELLAADPAVLRWAGWFAHPLAGAVLLGSAGVLGLFLYSQVLTILANIATQPTWAQYAGYGGLALLAGAVLSSMLRLALLYARLRANRQVRVRGLEELHARVRLRWLAHAKAAEAKASLEAYLKSYPLDGPKARTALGRLGITGETATSLAAVRDELLDPARFGSTGQWFDRFRDGFQAKLDEAAEARTKYWANRAMLVTAVAPNGLVDSLGTVYFGFALLTDLGRVYNLRAGRTGTAVLLGRVFFNAYLAGNMTDVEALAADQYEHLYEQGLHVLGVGVGSNVVGKFLGKVGAKATTGYLNRVLLIRLGRYAARLLRPVDRDR
jgi:uncharacterized membrane protein YcjF (UPF0283 family)